MIDFDWSYLGIIDFQSAASGINVGSIQILASPSGRIQIIELDHGLDTILFEYDNAQHLAMWMTDFVQDILKLIGIKRKIRNECNRQGTISD